MKIQSPKFLNFPNPKKLQPQILANYIIVVFIFDGLQYFLPYIITLRLVHHERSQMV